MNIFEPPLHAYVPGAVMNLIDMSLSSQSSWPSWKTTREESTTETIRDMISPAHGISKA